MSRNPNSNSEFIVKSYTNVLLVMVVINHPFMVRDTSVLNVLIMIYVQCVFSKESIGILNMPYSRWSIVWNT